MAQQEQRPTGEVTFLQSKHTGGAQACCSDNDFKTRMKHEAKKVKKPIADNDSPGLLTEHGDICDRYEEDVRTPVRFNGDDLIKIICAHREFEGRHVPRCAAFPNDSRRYRRT